MYYSIYFKFIIGLMSVRTKGDFRHMQFRHCNRGISMKSDYIITLGSKKRNAVERGRVCVTPRPLMQKY